MLVKMIFFAFLFFPSLIEAQTKRINFKAYDIYPEGTAYTESNRSFFVSSVKTGTIGSVSEQGAYKIFYEDSSLKSSFGMKTDAKRNKLWICAGDPNYSKYSDSATYKKMIRLIGLDMSSGRKTEDIDLSKLHAGKHFANDLVVDDKSNIYITDSYSPVIYKVDAQMKASVFATNDGFASMDVGLNGIVWSPEGFLIVANNSSGCLYKISINDPKQVTKIKIRTFFPGADGLLWDAQNNLILVQNKGVNKVIQLHSKDNWESAEVIGSTIADDRFKQPSTAVLVQGKVYALNSKLNEITDPTLFPAKEFSLQLARFLPMR